MESLKEVLMMRDEITKEEAEQQISEARAELHSRLEDGEMPFDICEELFGLEPDYLEELM